METLDNVLLRIPYHHTINSRPTEMRGCRHLAGFAIVMHCPMSPQGLVFVHIAQGGGVSATCAAAAAQCNVEVPGASRPLISGNCSVISGLHAVGCDNRS